jgi:hypothetical protein
MSSTNKSDRESMAVSGTPLSPSHGSTYAERQAYRRNVLCLPGPVDRWLLANIRSPHVGFLRDYLMFADVRNAHVTCLVEIEHEVVSSTVSIIHGCLTLMLD